MKPEYTILINWGSRAALVREVMQHLASGWEPAGGPFFIQDGNTTGIAQAVWKRGSEGKPGERR